MAYADYHDMMKMTEEMFSGMVKSITGSFLLKITKDDEEIEIDFTPPFKRISMISSIEEATATKIPIENTQDCLVVLERLLLKYDLNCAAPRSVSRMLDKLVEHFIEDNKVRILFKLQQIF